MADAASERNRRFLQHASDPSDACRATALERR
jgi:hypothetical protein